MIKVTGVSGFVGQNLISYLKGKELDFVARQQLNSISVVELVNCNAIIHLAGKAHDLKKTSSPQEYYEVNYELTKKLYDCFLKSEVQKFIFISSVKAVADSVDGILNEDTKSNPVTDYGKSKLLAEEYIQSQPLPKGKAYYVLRPCMIHGPGNKGNLNLLYQFVKKGIPYPLAAFENKRSFLSVENLCFVIKNLLEKEVPAGVYHVADDEALSTNEVVQLLAQAQGRKAKLWRLSASMLKGVAKIGTLLKLPLNSERLQKLTESYVVSNEKIKKALGDELPVSAREGLLRTARSFASH